MTAHYNHHPIHSFLVFQRLYGRTFDSLLVYSKVCELCNHCRLGRQKRRELDIFCPKNSYSLIIVKADLAKTKWKEPVCEKEAIKKFLMTFSNEPIFLQMYTTSLRDLVMTFSSFNLQLSSLFLLRWISSVYLSSFKWVKKRMGMKYFSSISEIDVVFCRVAYLLELLVCNPYSPFIFKTALHLVDFGHDCHYINFHKRMFKKFSRKRSNVDYETRTLRYFLPSSNSTSTKTMKWPIWTSQ